MADVSYSVLGCGFDEKDYNEKHLVTITRKMSQELTIPGLMLFTIIRLVGKLRSNYCDIRKHFRKNPLWVNFTVNEQRLIVLVGYSDCTLEIGLEGHLYVSDNIRALVYTRDGNKTRIPTGLAYFKYSNLPTKRLNNRYIPGTVEAVYCDHLVELRDWFSDALVTLSTTGVTVESLVSDLRLMNLLALEIDNNPVLSEGFKSEVAFRLNRARLEITDSLLSSTSYVPNNRGFDRTIELGVQRCELSQGNDHSNFPYLKSFARAVPTLP